MIVSFNVTYRRHLMSCNDKISESTKQNWFSYLMLAISFFYVNYILISFNDVYNNV